MYPSDNELCCKRCGFKKSKGKAQITSKEIERNEIVVTESIEGTLPKTNIICLTRGHNEASWVIRQTRAADEPSTRIYQCTNKKCVGSLELQNLFSGNSERLGEIKSLA